MTISAVAGLYDALHAFFKLYPGNHYRMLAAQAFDPDIGSCPQHLPEFTAAWMWLFHFHRVAYFELFDFHQTTSCRIIASPSAASAERLSVCNASFTPG